MRLALILLLVPSIAAAEGNSRITAGFGLGMTQSEENAQDDPNSTLNLYGRVAISRRVSGQLEIERIRTDETSETNLRSVSGLFLVDLGKSRVMPVLMGGVGIDNESSTYEDRDYMHAFLGVGVEYRADNGVVIGGDVRLGGRVTTEPQYKAQPVNGGVLERLPAPDLEEGEYRAARVTVGIHF